MKIKLDVLKSMKYDGQKVVKLWNPKNSLETGRMGLENIRKLSGSI